MMKLPTIGIPLKRDEMKLMKGGLAEDGASYSTSCECVGSVGAWLANYSGGLFGAIGSSAVDAATYCPSKTVKCQYKRGGVEGSWTVSAN